VLESYWFALPIAPMRGEHARAWRAASDDPHAQAHSNGPLPRRAHTISAPLRCPHAIDKQRQAPGIYLTTRIRAWRACLAWARFALEVGGNRRPDNHETYACIAPLNPPNLR
jgi:hypothetical protein